MILSWGPRSPWHYLSMSPVYCLSRLPKDVSQQRLDSHCLRPGRGLIRGEDHNARIALPVLREGRNLINCRQKMANRFKTVLGTWFF